MSLYDAKGSVGLQVCDLGTAVGYAEEAHDALVRAGFGERQPVQRLREVVDLAQRLREQLDACEDLVAAVSRDLNNNVHDLTSQTTECLDELDEAAAQEGILSVTTCVRCGSMLSRRPDGRCVDCGDVENDDGLFDAAEADDDEDTEA